MTIRIFILASALLAPFMAVGSASAWVQYYVPATTTHTYIGTVMGDAWAAHMRPNGCLWTKLGEGGLEHDSTIIGVSTGEVMLMVKTTTNVCNFSMSALITHDWELALSGQGGNDVLIGENIATHMNGGADNDVIWGYGTSARSFFRGGSGNDIISGGGAMVDIYGEGGDDHVCMMSPTSAVYGLIGGDGYDVGCGSATHGRTTIEDYSQYCSGQCDIF